MANVLVADHERSVRRALLSIFGKIGHDVVEAANGRAALEAVSQGNIDIILLAATMPGMDGWEVLAKLKEDPRTKAIPVVLLTSVRSPETEAEGLRMGVSHIIAKPCHPDTLMTIVRLALREAERTVQPVQEERIAPPVAEDPPYRPEKSSGPRKFIGTGGGFSALDRVLGGGIPLEELTLIEGTSKTGKSVICQYLTYGAVLDGRTVVYFVSNETADGLVQQMASVGLDMSDYVQRDQLRIYPMQPPPSDEDPKALLAELISDIQRAPAADGLVVVDSIASLAIINEDRTVMSFFSSCQRLCSEGRTIVMVADPSAFDQQMIVRLHGMCNTHIRISAESIRDRFVKTLEVTKANNVDQSSDNRFSFQVEPEGGIRIIPVSRVRA